MDTSLVRQKYDAFASSYDWSEGIIEVLGLRRLRRAALSAARGKVLEVGIGTGKSLFHYPPGCDITGVDVSRQMLAQANMKIRRLGLNSRCVQMDVHSLGFADASFDTVVEALCLCTYAEPVVALGEMARVVVPEGRILLLEHGRSDRRWLGRLQDRTAALHESSLGCMWNREPQELVAQAGLRLKRAHRSFFGVFHLLELVISRSPQAAVGTL